jgi:hypothetical protein
VRERGTTKPARYASQANYLDNGVVLVLAELSGTGPGTGSEGWRDAVKQGGKRTVKGRSGISVVGTDHLANIRKITPLTAVVTSP